MLRYAIREQGAALGLRTLGAGAGDGPGAERLQQAAARVVPEQHREQRHAVPGGALALPPVKDINSLSFTKCINFHDQNNSYTIIIYITKR